MHIQGEAASAEPVQQTVTAREVCFWPVQVQNVRTGCSGQASERQHPAITGGELDLHVAIA
jgi:hypothetical protein